MKALTSFFVGVITLFSGLLSGVHQAVVPTTTQLIKVKDKPLTTYFGTSTIVIGNDGVCTKENNCPRDKCDAEIFCDYGGGGLGGCPIGGYNCLYKDSSLRENYKEISYDEALSCTKAYIKKNKNNDLYQYIDFESASHEDTGAGRYGQCGENPYCWLVNIKQTNPNIYPDILSFYVGAQSCEVHPSN
jgi:hypothetical protein